MKQTNKQKIPPEIERDRVRTSCNNVTKPTD